MKALPFAPIALLISVLFFSSCSKNNLTMSVIEPAPVHVSGNVKSLGILNRSQPSTSENKTLDDIEKVLTAEGRNLDKHGAESTITGLKDELEYGDRFPVVKILDPAGFKNPGMGVLPSAIPWDKLQAVCDENGIDAIFSLAFYDTQSKVDVKVSPTEIQSPIGGTIPAIEQKATVNTLIKTGWRIYDVKNRVIIDEYFMNRSHVAHGSGLTPIQAVQAIIGRKEAVVDISNKIGHDYGFRVFPYKIRVTREYFVKGTNNFKIAKRRAQTGDWDGAAELWEKETNNSKMKVAGRAHYNMAIINEINGNLDEAIEWASKAYTDYKNKDALSYLKVLKNRKRRNAQAQQQMDY